MQPTIVRYEIRSPKVRQELDLLFLADLHGMVYGKDNRCLIRMARDIAPDMILIGGDMLTCRHAETYRTAERLLASLTRVAPVFAVNGNHETCACRKGGRIGRLFGLYVKRLRERGVCFVNNDSCLTQLKGTSVEVTGYEAPLTAYQKFRIPRLDPRTLPPVTAGRDDRFSILLAHNPAFGRAYLTYGADLTLSGHYHGGVMRFGRHGVLASPYGFPLPRYGYGLYKAGPSHMIVTAGLGDHAIPFRINNPFEMAVIHVVPSSDSRNR